METKEIETVEALLSKFNYKQKIVMRWKDIDEMHHVNNAVYLTYFEEARWRYLNQVCDWNWDVDGVILAHVSIDYMAPLVMRSEPVIYLRVSKLGTKSFDFEFVIVNEAGGKQRLVAKGKSTLVGFEYKTQGTIAFNEETRQKLIAFDGKKMKI